MPIGQKKGTLHEDRNVTIGAGMGALAALLALGIFLAAVISLTVRGAQVTSRDVAWIAGVPEPSPAEADVYSRYLQRHRTHRVVGGLLGALFAISVGTAWYGSVRIGVGFFGFANICRP